MTIRIGSRGSDLALWQANFVKDQLVNLGHEIEIEIIETKGDKVQDLSFDKIEGKGFFTKEIEDALLAEEVDVAVHSYKDMETKSPDGLCIGAVSYRENPTDCLIVRKNSYSVDSSLHLKEGGIIGTSSARRQSLIRRLNPALEIRELRGNVPTRIQKLRDGQYDAIVLASAGIQRLNLELSEFELIELSVEEFVPAPAQGVLGIQIKNDNPELQFILAELHEQKVANCIDVEREILRQMDGGCQLPLGVHCYLKDNQYHVYTSFATSKEDVAAVDFFQAGQTEGLASRISTALKNRDDNN